MADTEARWYCLNALGQATLCRDEADALDCAKESDATWPRNAPSRAVLLGPVADLLAERDRLRAALDDADSDAHRLALELECLLLDRDVPVAATSRWWESSHEALMLHRQRLNPLQALADNAREMGLSYDDPNAEVTRGRRPSR